MQIWRSVTGVLMLFLTWWFHIQTRRPVVACVCIAIFRLIVFEPVDDPRKVFDSFR
jgi:hypothetical protein